MPTFRLHPTGEAIEIEAASVVRLSKLDDGSGDVDPSVIVTDDGRFVVDDSIRTIEARFGADLVTSPYIDQATERYAAFALSRVSALSKLNHDSSAGDPTVVHLSTGETLTASESILTLSARLGLQAGLETVDIDIEGDPRPACVVADRVERVLRLGAGDGARSLVCVTGSAGFPCHDDADRLKALVADAARGPEGDGPVSPSP